MGACYENRSVRNEPEMVVLSHGAMFVQIFKITVSNVWMLNIMREHNYFVKCLCGQSGLVNTKKLQIY